MVRVNREEIKRRRIKLGLTLKEAATEAGWKTHMQWYDIESGRKKDPQVSTLGRIAKVLKCRPAALLTGE